MKIVESLLNSGIKYIVCEKEVNNSTFINEFRSANMECISVLDARSAVYYATGISANDNAVVLVCINSVNSRSAFSGMTEAFYRQLPIVLVTLGNELDYSLDIKDTVTNHYIFTSDSDKLKLLDVRGPIHIEIRDINIADNKVYCKKLNAILSEILDCNTYLYYGQKVSALDLNSICKTVMGGIRNSVDGTLSNVIGASLANVRTRYVGVVSEEEFLHDMNSLGNVNINDLLLFIVVLKKKNEIILDYAKSLGFVVDSLQYDKIEMGKVKDIVDNGKKSVLMIYEEI